MIKADANLLRDATTVEGTRLIVAQLGTGTGGMNPFIVVVISMLSEASYGLMECFVVPFTAPSASGSS